MKKMTNQYNFEESIFYKRNMLINQRIKKGAIISLVVALVYVVSMSSIS